MKNSNFNTVNVSLVNEYTGNHCINIGQLINGKNFKFVIDKDEYELTPKSVMSYIAANPNCYRKKRFENEETGRISYGSFYLINDNYIINNAI